MRRLPCWLYGLVTGAGFAVALFGTETTIPMDNLLPEALEAEWMLAVINGLLLLAFSAMAGLILAGFVHAWRLEFSKGHIKEWEE